MKLVHLTISVLLLSATQYLMAQDYAGLSIDNDLFFGKDYYYSSGIFLQFGYNKDPNAKAREEHALFQEESNKHKGIKSVHWTLGQQIFNPIGRYDSISAQMDYPFSGHVYLERKVRIQTSEHRFKIWGVQLGLSGPPSMSQPIQNAYHKWVLGLPPLSWVDQQPAGVHMGIQAQWAASTNSKSEIHFTRYFDLQLGTHQSQASMRIGIQWGPLNPLTFYGPPVAKAQSGWSTHLGIQLKYSLQDFNLSGSLFNNKSPFTLPANSFRNTLEAGFAYRIPNWQFIAMAKSRSKDTAGQKYARHEVLYLSILRIW